MFRLKHFKATNVSGFMFGLGKKTVDLDLSSIYTKDVIVILGDNGLGKSVLLSLIHPTHKPTDKRDNFILKGKEGKIERTYVGDDGTTIISRAIYTPKKDGHTTKLYLSIIRAGSTEEVELNPSGNVTSYYEILYTYMGITKDYVTFASYNDLVSNIVDMTDTERKLNVSSLIPNTKRFETSYQIINDKYRDVRNIMQNISQKITQLGDEADLAEQVSVLEKELSRVRADRDKAIEKSAKLKGRVKELTGGKSPEELEQACQTSHTEMIELYSKSVNQIDQLTKLLNIDNEQGSSKSVIRMAKEACEALSDYEWEYAKMSSSHEAYIEKRKDMLEQISEMETELDELNAQLYSLQTQDLDALMSNIEGLKEKRKSLSYSPDKDKLDGMTFEEAMLLSNTITNVLSQCTWLLEKYGEMFTLDFTGRGEIAGLLQDGDAEYYLHQAEQKERELYGKITELEQYRKLQMILDKRPSTCHDDTCPFIANALQWKSIEVTLNKLKEEYHHCTEEVTQRRKHMERVDMAHQYESDITQLMNLSEDIRKKVKLYTGVSLMDVIESLSTGDTKKYYDLQDAIKRVAKKLSEKNLYDDITMRQLPQLEAMIDMAKNAQVSRMSTQKKIDRITDKLSGSRRTLDQMVIDNASNEDRIDKIKRKVKSLRQINSILSVTDKVTSDFVNKEAEYKKLSETVESIADMKARIRDYEDTIKQIDKIIKDLVPQADMARYNLQQLAMLKFEESKENYNFTVLNMMRSIIMPGKGLWKEAISIYMDKINVIANQVLRNTFDGELILEPFELTDKSFFMPYIFKGNRSPDISLASSSQRSTVATAISMAIISEMVDKYSTITLDEFDKTLSPTYKDIITEVLIKSMQTLGIGTAFVITHNPENYEKSAVDVGYIIFPGGKLSGKKHKDFIEI